jgi:peptide/nickel transport system substrate-binding protein
MTRFDAVRERLAPLKERLDRSYSLGFVEQAHAWIESLSSGDRVIAYTLAGLVAITSLSGVYGLQQSLLIAEPAYGGSLVEGEVGSPRFINPLLALSDSDRDLSTLTYAGLMGLSGDGGLIPVLAQSYEISPDGKTYTFTLRPDAKFSDGSAVTAGDVVFTVEKAQDPAIKSPEYANWSGVRAEEVDTHTVRFTLAKPYAPFIGITTLGILPAKLWGTISDQEFAFSTYQTAPVGAGPFKVTDVSRDAAGLIESVTLSANKHYPLGRPYLDSITFQFYSRTEDLAEALADGSVASAYDIPSPSARSAPYARIFGVFFNQSEKQVYTRIEVRKALSIAINRPGIIADVLGGSATPIMGPVPPDLTITQVPIPAADNRIAAAADVLENAGWKYSPVDRVWKHAAAKQTLDTITIRTSNVPELKSVASAVKSDWEKLGIPVTIELYEPGDLSQNIIRPRKYEALLYGMVIGRNQDLYAFWSSQERNDPGLNIALYANKTVDALLESARTETDAHARLRDLQKIQNAVAADYPAAFIYAPSFTYSLPEDVGGVVLPQIVTPSDRFANVAQWYRETDRVWPFFARAAK